MKLVIKNVKWYLVNVCILEVGNVFDEIQCFLIQCFWVDPAIL